MYIIDELNRLGYRTKTLPAPTLKPTENFSIYLQNTYDKYSYIKTLLYNDQPRKFYDFYVCNNVYQKINSSQNVVRKIKSTTIRHFILTRIAEKRSNKAYYKHLIRQIK